MKNDTLLEVILERRKTNQCGQGNDRRKACSLCMENVEIVATCLDCGDLVCNNCLKKYTSMAKNAGQGGCLVGIDGTGNYINVDLGAMSMLETQNVVDKDKDIKTMSCQNRDGTQIHTQLQDVVTMAKREREKLASCIQQWVTLIDTKFEYEMFAAEYVPDYSTLETIVEEYADNMEQSIINTNESVLNLPNQATSNVKQKSEKKVEDIRRAKASIISEIVTVKAFSEQYIDNLFTKLKEMQTKSKRLSEIVRYFLNDVDDLAFLKVASELNSVCEVIHSEVLLTEKEFHLEVDSDEDTDQEEEEEEEWTFQGLRLSPFSGIYWKRRDDISSSNDFDISSALHIWDIHTPLVDKKFVVKRYQHQEDRRFRFAVLEMNRTADLDNDRSLLPTMTETSPDSITGDMYKMLSLGSLLATVSSKPGNDDNLMNQIKCFKITSSEHIGSCVAQGFSDDEIIVGVFDSLKLYKCNLKSAEISTIQAKVNEIKPPVSLASNKGGIILLCDAKNKAVAIDIYGELMYEYFSRHIHDKPLHITADRQGFVYVLWEIGHAGDTTLEDEMNDCRQLDTDRMNDEDAFIDEYDWEARGSNKRKVVMQYTPKGKFISEFEVNGNVTKMATVPFGVDNTEGISCAGPYGVSDVFHMVSILLR